MDNMKKEKIHKSMFYRILQLLMKIPILQNVRILFYFYDKLILLFIKKPPHKKMNKKQVLIVFPFALGDCVMFLGPLAYLKTVYPAKEYGLQIVCQKGYEELFAGYFDNVLSFEYTRASVDLIYRFKMYRKLRNQYYDIVVDPIGCEECSPNVFSVNALCATEKIGVLTLSDKKAQCPVWMRNKIYDRIITIEGKNLHKIKYYAKVWEKLGDVDCIAHPAEFKPMTLQLNLPDKFFVVFPSASLSVKQWPVERFAEIAERVYHKTGYPLVVCGTRHDAVVMNEFIEKLHNIPIYNFVGQTSVTEFIELIGRTSLLITNDTSTYHIGVAKKRKVCIVTGGYVYETFINYQYEEQGYRNPVIVCKKKVCYNCNNMCIYKVKETYPCVEEVTIDDVWYAVESLLDEEDAV